MIFTLLTGEMRSAATLFCRGISTCFHAVQTFAKSVIKAYRNEIRLPSAAECEEIAVNMYAERIAALDGKHFAVSGGADDDVSLKNYKGFRSITVLGMVNHLYKFIWFGDFWPGSNLLNPVDGMGDDFLRVQDLHLTVKCGTTVASKKIWRPDCGRHLLHSA